MDRTFLIINLLLVFYVITQQQDNNTQNYNSFEQQTYLSDILAVEEGYDDQQIAIKNNNNNNNNNNINNTNPSNDDCWDQYDRQLCDCNEFDEIEFECRNAHYTCSPIPRQRVSAAMSRDQEVAYNWPYLISFQKAESSNKPNCYRHFCGGSLINTNLVLTAAHCFDKYLAQNQKEGVPTINLYAAKFPICRHVGSRGTAWERARVTYMYIHPDWDRSTGNADIAILVLDTLFEGPYVTINAYDQITSFQQKKSLYIAGYGVSNKEEMVQRSIYNMREPIQVQLNHTSAENCSTLLTQFGSKNGIMDDTMICGYNPTGDSCPGDSGGPLAIRGSNPGDDELLGVISWGPPLQCESRFAAQAPVVATKVSAFVNWIKNTSSSYQSIVKDTLVSYPSRMTVSFNMQTFGSICPKQKDNDKNGD